MVGTTYGNSEVNLLSETAGRVLSIHANIGDRVSVGSVIAKVDDEIKKANLLTAEANFDKAKKDLERYEQLFKEKSANEAQLDQARLAYKLTESAKIIASRQLKDASITSPISGVITARNIEVGSVVGQNTPVATIIDVSTLKVKINVAEKDVFKLKVNDEVDVSAEDILPGSVIKGRIKNINAKADESHTYAIEITIPNNGKIQLKSGMFVRVYFNSIAKGETIVLPRDAIIGSVRNPQIYVVEGDKAYLRNILIGAESGKKVEILQGVKVGEQVVTNGQINLKDGVKVSIVK
jgi:RND family efflux transporter MFP subunit